MKKHRCYVDYIEFQANNQGEDKVKENPFEDVKNHCDMHTVGKCKYRRLNNCGNNIYVYRCYKHSIALNKVKRLLWRLTNRIKHISFFKNHSPSLSWQDVPTSEMTLDEFDLGGVECADINNYIVGSNNINVSD